MNCWHCKTELIWGGDHDCDVESFSTGIAANEGEDVECMHEDYSMVTNLSCPKCNSLVLVYSPSCLDGPINLIQEKFRQEGNKKKYARGKRSRYNET